MQRRIWWGVLGAACFIITLAVGFARAQNSSESGGSWNAAALKKGIEDIGYETKALNATESKEKYEFKLERGGLNIPIAAEISASKNYIWLTVFLGTAPTDFATSGTKLGGLMKANYKVQPCQFYITEKGALMLAVAIDNRQMSNPILRRNVEKLVSDVVEQKSNWQM